MSNPLLADVDLLFGRDLEATGFLRLVRNGDTLFKMAPIAALNYDSISKRVGITGADSGTQQTIAAKGLGGNPKTELDADKHLADILEKVQDQMSQEGWKPPLTKTGNPDSGAYGKEVHRRASELLKNANGYYTDVFVDANGKILSIGGPPPGGLKDTTQIDILAVKHGYKLKVGDVIDPEKLLGVYDIKTGAAKLEGDQLERLQKIVERGAKTPDELKKGPKVKSLRHKYVYQQGKGLTVNPRFTLIVRMISIFGLAGAVNATLHASQYDGELDEIEHLMKQFKFAPEDQKKVIAVEILGKMRNYFSHFVDDDFSLNLVTLGQLYDLLGR